MTPLQSKTSRSGDAHRTFGPLVSRLVLALGVVLAVALAPLVLSPTAAHAAESIAYVRDSSGKETYYEDWDAAKSAAYGEGNTLVMLADWGPTSIVYVADSKSLTIDMNGHRITSKGYGSAIYLNEHSSLTLKSSAPSTTFSYEGFEDLSKKKVSLELVSGGLVTGGHALYGGGIHMEADCQLTLDGVAVAGNHTSTSSTQDGRGGGIYVKNKGTINIKNNASIQHNAAYFHGGGICVEGDDPTTINMDGAKICKNHAGQYGGGIYIKNTKNVHINLTNNAAVDDNEASQSGGGICFECTSFYLESSDKTGSVSGNRVSNPGYKGGGICVSYISEAFKESLIRGINIKNNYSSIDGGGIRLGQELTKVVDCTITGNDAGGDGGGVYIDGDNNAIEGCTITGNEAGQDGGGVYIDNENSTIKGCAITGNSAWQDGGGVYIDNDDNAIEDCTITGNYCDLDGKNYEGGGVFVSYTNDVKMSGLNIITGNTRGKASGNADDVFLSQNVGNTIRAYITGGLAKGSKVGVRTGATGDRRVASGFKSDTKDCLFADLGGYYVSYGTDEGGDAWQRHASKEFTLKVNGSGSNRYAYGTTVTVNGNSADSSKVFRRWSATASTGLYPFSSYVSDTDLTNPVVSFAMPQNDADIVAEYVTRATSVTLAVDAPVPGQDFAATGSLSWEGSDGTERRMDVRVRWFELSDGSYSLVSGTADYSTEYVIMTAVSQDLDSDLAFALDLGADDVTVNFTGDGPATSVKAREASVSAGGSLSLISDAVTTDRPTVVEADVLELEVEEGTSERDLLAQVPKTVAARTNAGTAVTLDVGTGGADFSGVVSDGKVVRPEGGQATVRLPVGYAGGDASVPDGMAADLVVTVRDKAAEPVAEPTVSPEGGTYSTTDDADKFVDGRLKVGATCEDGAELRYTLYSYAGGAWSKTAEDASWPEGGVELAAKAGSQAGYKLEVWAARGDVESVRRTLTYVIDDVRPAETVAVTVKYADTAADGQHGSRDSETVEVVKGSDAALMASSWPGYSFEKWLAADGTTVLGTDPTLTLEGVTEDTTVTALYNPTVSGLDVSLDIPEADKALAGSAAKVEARLADSASYVDVTSYFAGADGKVAIAWSPAAREDGSAAHDACYTAVLTPDAAASGNVRYLLARDAEVLVNGYPVEGAYVVERDGKTSVCVECPNTGALEYKSVEALSPIAVSFEDALAAKKAQGAGEGISAWDLPFTARVTYACGEHEDYEITWNSIGELDESATGEQELTATGTISFPAYVEHDGPTETVTVKLRIAAPKADPEPEPVETHVVTFDTAGGSEVASQTVEDGKCATRPATDPTRDGYEFAGWYADESLTEEFDFTKAITADVTVYAKWVAISPEPEPTPSPEPEPEPEPSPSPDPSPEPAPDADTDGDDQPSDSGKALPSTGDLGSVAAAASAAVAGLGALTVGLRRRK